MKTRSFSVCGIWLGSLIASYAAPPLDPLSAGRVAVKPSGQLDSGLPKGADLAHPLDEWHERAPLPTSRTLQDIAFDGEQYVVLEAGQEGRALVSRDLKEWKWRKLGLPEALEPERIAFKDERHVLIAEGRVWCRTGWQGEWAEAISFWKPPSELRVVNGEFWAWDKGGFVVPTKSLWASDEGGFLIPPKRQTKVGPFPTKNSILRRSSDGLTWKTVPTQPVDGHYLGIEELIYANGTYVLVNGGQLFYSGDGTDWVRVRDSEQKAVRSVAYGNGVFLAGGWLHTGTSADGKTWSFDEHPFVSRSVEVDRIEGYELKRTEGRQMKLAFLEKQFVALLGRTDIGHHQAAFTSDGKKWSNTKAVPTQHPRLRQAGDKAFTLAEGGGLTVADPDEARFRQILPILPWSWTAVAANDHRVVVGGEGGHVAWSDDVITFHHVILPDPATVRDIVWAPELNRFVAVGGDIVHIAHRMSEFGRVWTSPNGIDWTTAILPPTIGRITGVAWNGSKFVLCGYKGQVATSADGVNWTVQASGTTKLIYDVVWGGGNFVASVMEGHVLNSEDGIHWIVTDLGARITGIPGPGPVYGNGTWIILRGGPVYWSKDLKHWNREPSRGASSPAIYAFGEFIASGHRRLVSSADGFHWHPRTDKHVTYGRFLYRGFQAAARFQQQIVYVGHGGRISVSGIWP